MKVCRKKISSCDGFFLEEIFCWATGEAWQKVKSCYDGPQNIFDSISHNLF